MFGFIKNKFKGVRFAGVMALTLFALPGCVAGSGSASGDEGAGLGKQPMVATGALQAAIDNKTIAIDYTGQTVEIALSHRINTDAKGLSCVPLVTIAASLPDKTCRLELNFKAGFEGDGLILDTAKFYAKQGIYQPDGNGKQTLIGTTPCTGWVDEPKKGEVIYEKDGGEATMGMDLLKQPYAGQAKATLSGLFFQPHGVVKMKYLGRSFDLDMSKLTFKGSAVSTGSADLACAKTFHDFPAWKLPDVQKKSTGFGATYGLSAWQGKRVILMMGAGWCASCQEQAKIMGKVAGELANAGRSDVAMVAISDPGTPLLTDYCAFPVFKGDWSVHTMLNADGSTHKGFKNDAYAYDYDGRLMGFFQGEETVYTNLFEDFVRKNANAAKNGTGGVDCRLDGSNKRSCGPATGAP